MTQSNIKHFEWLDEYLEDTDYIGIVGDDYRYVCDLKFEEINNFIQNVGKFADVSIVSNEDGSILLDTKGNNVDSIFPAYDVVFPGSTPEEKQNSIDQLDFRLSEQREKDGNSPKPLPNVAEFIETVQGEQQKNDNESNNMNSDWLEAVKEQQQKNENEASETIQSNIKYDDWLDEYLVETDYFGIVGDDYSSYCDLKFDEINNFIQNVGRFSDVKVGRNEDSDILLNTKGIYVDRIFPELSSSDRSTNSMMNNINQIAFLLYVQREKDGNSPKPLPNVSKFIETVFGEQQMSDTEEHEIVM